MKTSLPFTSILLLASTVITLAAPDMLPYRYGMSTDPNTKVEYSISSDGGKTEKQKSVQLITKTPGTEKNVVSNSRTISFLTGKSKTVGQILELLTGIFEKFLANPAPGSVLGKLGSLDKGGEVAFVATSSDTLRFDFKSANGLQASEFTKADAANYLALLKK